MGWGTAITTGLQIGSSLFGGNQARKAADAQGKQAQAAADYAKGVYSDAQGNFQPYLGLGQTGASGLQALYGGDNSGWMNSPDYLAARDGGLYAMDHSASAKGRLGSGGYAMDAAQGLANINSGFMGNYRNGLMGLAGMGQQAAGSLGSIGTNVSGQVGQAYGALGNAQAQRYGATAGQAAGIFNSLGNLAGGFNFGGGGGSSAYGVPAQGSGTMAGFGGTPNYQSGGAGTFWGSP